MQSFIYNEMLPIKNFKEIWLRKKIRSSTEETHTYKNKDIQIINTILLALDFNLT